MSSVWVIRPGVGVGPFLLGDTLRNVLSKVNELGFTFSLIYDVTKPMEGDMVVDIVAMRLIFEAITQRLRVVHMYPFPQPTSLYSVTLRPSSRKFKDFRYSLPPLSLETDPMRYLPASTPPPCLSILLGILGSAQICLAADLSCVLAYPDKGITLLSPHQPRSRNQDGAISVFPDDEPEILVHTPLSRAVNVDPHAPAPHITWFPAPVDQPAPPAVSFTSPLARLPSPPLHPQDHYASPLFMVPGVGVTAHPPTATVTDMDPRGLLRARLQVSKGWLRVGDPVSAADRLLGPPDELVAPLSFPSAVAADLIAGTTLAEALIGPSGAIVYRSRSVDAAAGLLAGSEHAAVLSEAWTGLGTAGDADDSRLGGAAGVCLDACGRTVLWEYHSRGLTVVVDVEAKTILSIVAHNALPTHPSFAKHHRANFFLIPSLDILIDPSSPVPVPGFAVVLPGEPDLPSPADERVTVGGLSKQRRFMLLPRPLSGQAPTNALPALLAAADATPVRDADALTALADSVGYLRAPVRPDSTVIDVAVQLAAGRVASMDPQQPLLVPSPHAVPWRSYWPSQTPHHMADTADTTIDADTLAEQVSEQAQSVRAETTGLVDAAKAMLQSRTAPTITTIPGQTVEDVFGRPSSVDETGRPDEATFSTVWGYWWDGVAIECDDMGWIGKITIY